MLTKSLNKSSYVSKLIQLNITLTESSREINKAKAKEMQVFKIANENIKTKEPKVNCTIILCDTKNVIQVEKS